MLNKNGKSGKISEETAMILLCHEMHWDYYTYLKQPNWFLIGLRTKLNLEAYYQNIQQKKLNKR